MKFSISHQSFENMHGSWVDHESMLVRVMGSCSGGVRAQANVDAAAALAEDAECRVCSCFEGAVDNRWPSPPLFGGAKSDSKFET